MKWSIVGLLSLGLLAAVSAFFLVLTLRDDAPKSTGEATNVVAPDSNESKLVDIVLAARPVEAFARLDVQDLRVERVPLHQAEDLLRKGAFRDPLQVAGRVTEVSMQPGELVVPDMLVRRESGLMITTALAQGKRAVSLSLSDTMGIEALLYPGCTVDVIAALDVRNTLQGDPTPLSMTLLRDIYVLAVGDRSVVSPEGGEEQSATTVGGKARPTVTLLVTPKETELLKLAMSEGSISLTLRDPRDANAEEETSATRLADLSPSLGAFEARANKRMLVDDLRVERERLEAQRALAAEVSPPWRAEVIRGSSAESKTFEKLLPKGGN